MSNLAQSPFPNKVSLRLVYRPSLVIDYETGRRSVFWRLYTEGGVRFTPDVLDNDSVAQLERNIRSGVAFQYWQPEWM